MVYERRPKSTVSECFLDPSENGHTVCGCNGYDRGLQMAWSADGSLTSKSAMVYGSWIDRGIGTDKFSELSPSERDVARNHSHGARLHQAHGVDCPVHDRGPPGNVKAPATGMESESASMRKQRSAERSITHVRVRSSARRSMAGSTWGG